MILEPDEPAFPYLYGEVQYVGLTAREYMATHLLAGLLAARPQATGPFESMAERQARVARTAVEMADQLIDALNVPALKPVSVREDDGELQ